MALDITKLKSDLSNLVAQEAAAEAKEAADLQTIQATINDLKAKLAAGETVTQADIDALDAQVGTVASGLTNVVNNLDAAANPPATPAA